MILYNYNNIISKIIHINENQLFSLKEDVYASGRKGKNKIQLSYKKRKKYLLFVKFIIQCIRAMKVIETGQDWKIAALRSSFHVHFLFWRN